MLKKAAWAVMALLSIGVAGYALGLALVPGWRNGFVANLIEQRALPTYGHLVGGGLALLLGVFQFNRTLRTRHVNIHRWIGRGYILACLAGGTAGLALALKSTGGAITHFGFGLLAVCWLIATLTAFVCIRRGNVAAHQQWMVRSFALTLAAVTLRIYLPVTQIQGIPMEVAYPVISWMCWVPNLIVAEWLVLSGRSARA
jgi:uncharacterized membrane protein